MPSFVPQFHTPLPKHFPKNEARFLLRELRDLLEFAKMEKASFGYRPGPNAEFTPGTAENVTNFIKKTTWTYRETWLIGPLEALINRYELLSQKENL